MVIQSCSFIANVWSQTLHNHYGYYCYRTPVHLYTFSSFVSLCAYLHASHKNTCSRMHAIHTHPNTHMANAANLYKGLKHFIVLLICPRKADMLHIVVCGVVYFILFIFLF